MNCSRDMCQSPLDCGYYNIKNNNTTEGRNYCAACGRAIVEHGRAIEYQVLDKSGKLLRERVIHFVDGANLKVGDVIAVWWNPGADTIASIKKYVGPLEHIWKKGAKYATFNVNRLGMTIDNGASYQIVEDKNYA